ncbi:hypothetical protein COLO4_35371 [Corchorus olitorius]|uniref:Uncharacterized protein n=1 Tax=Corchorus olitorius TaxID=93759 RepID=A0A1R3GH98_9ROSI|nr:hypothetical protein COLO4_35371 [Corchorus olitorius]
MAFWHWHLAVVAASYYLVAVADTQGKAMAIS